MGGAARGVCAGQRTIWWTFGWTEHFVGGPGCTLGLPRHTASLGGSAGEARSSTALMHFDGNAAERFWSCSRPAGTERVNYICGATPHIC